MTARRAWLAIVDNRAGAFMQRQLLGRGTRIRNAGIAPE